MCFLPPLRYSPVFFLEQVETNFTFPTVTTMNDFESLIELPGVNDNAFSGKSAEKSRDEVLSERHELTSKMPLFRVQTRKPQYLFSIERKSADTRLCPPHHSRQKV
jgi:hypothetical protein